MFAGIAVVVVLVCAVFLPLPAAIAREDPTPTPTPDRAPTVRSPGLQIALPAPEVGEVLLEDSLAQPGLVIAVVCPTGKNTRDFVGEGYIFRVGGKCTETATSAAVAQVLQGISFPDGEVRVELRAVSGIDRVRFYLFLRAAEDLSSYYDTIVIPATGSVILGRFVRGEQYAVLAQRQGVGDAITREDLEHHRYPC